jgi:tryptophanyl-tRNA synthetase
MKTILSGIMPSGTPHLGNYLGAIRQWVDFQETRRVIVMIADLHAITIPQKPEELRSATLGLAALLFACGIDQERSILFIQSHVPAHSELAWILNTLTPVGELERMTQFKEKQEKAGVMAGLLNYPVLQAADILLYRADEVPVGGDQIQHLEFARSLARRFNNRFRADLFTEPAAILSSASSRIMGLDDPSKKMSKSASSPDNYISLLDSPDEIRRKIQNAVTDSGSDIRFDPVRKPAVSNLIALYRGMSPHNVSVEDIEAKYRAEGYAEFKRDLAELLIEELRPIQTREGEISKNGEVLRRALEKGKEKAAAIANATLAMVKKHLGFVL